eukprot:12890424-Prorocentrum_lima.AAC.1
MDSALICEVLEFADCSNKDCSISPLSAPLLNTLPYVSSSDDSQSGCLPFAYGEEGSIESGQITDAALEYFLPLVAERVQGKLKALTRTSKLAFLEIFK